MIFVVFIKANPDLPICNRKKRELKSARESILTDRPYLRTSLIQGNIQEVNIHDAGELNWEDIIFPSRVSYIRYYIIIYIYYEFLVYAYMYLHLIIILNRFPEELMSLK